MASNSSRGSGDGPKDSLPARRDDASEPASLVRANADGADGWTGDEHALSLQAAKEVGLDPSAIELESYSRGFMSAMTLDDPLDHGLVARGRTVLSQSELLELLEPALQFMGVAKEHTSLRVHDASFELRIAGDHVRALGMVWDSTRTAVSLWIATVVAVFLVGRILLAAGVAVGVIGAVFGLFVMRSGLITGRERLAARLATSLAMVASAEQLVLPPRAT